eukprot:TRINITY_DN9593_c0_g1_i3.p2 TRINITY_DN9593_c0_g1~~TRINITY_DN9593_c0_g1_i3.p2  ORF type:complete len:130 (+),score=27.03 TRINITY_DN9593_c0_g1_i3:396-785(+)
MLFAFKNWKLRKSLEESQQNQQNEIISQKAIPKQQKVHKRTQLNKKHKKQKNLNNDKAPDSDEPQKINNSQKEDDDPEKLIEQAPEQYYFQNSPNERKKALVKPSYVTEIFNSNFDLDDEQDNLGLGQM